MTSKLILPNHFLFQMRNKRDHPTSLIVQRSFQTSSLFPSPLTRAPSRGQCQRRQYNTMSQCLPKSVLQATTQTNSFPFLLHICKEKTLELVLPWYPISAMPHPYLLSYHALTPSQTTQFLVCC